MAANAAASNLIDYLVKTIFNLIFSLTFKGRVMEKLKLNKIWHNCRLKALDNRIPLLREYQPTSNGYKLVFDLPIGLCPKDFINKKERLIYAFKKAEDIDIITEHRKLKIKVITIDEKPLF